MPSERDRLLRRLERRRRTRQRRAMGLAAVVVVLAAAIGVATVSTGRTTPRPPAADAPTRRAKATPSRPMQRHVAPPTEIRGVHVPVKDGGGGRLERYIAMKRLGLNTIELDVKNEAGRIGFVAGVPLATATGAAHLYYKPWAAAAKVHAARLYLIGRVVAFQDPVLAAARPDLAVRRTDGSVWRGDGGLAWVNPYDRRVWRYLADVGEAAARAGFDEIMFDYVRFPSDGDVTSARYRGAHGSQAETIAGFLRYASGRLRPLGVRVSAAVFGLSATVDVGVGQDPRLIGKAVDAVAPMVYPSHYTPGSYGLVDPNAAPAETVGAALRDFRAALRGSGARLVPWLQAFSLGRAYGLGEVQAQVEAARAAGAHGFLLWEHEGLYGSRIAALQGRYARIQEGRPLR